MQININYLKGSNALSYGDFHFIFDEHRVYQLIGKNGSGKSSLPVILEEVLFNSNSRGLTKAEIPHMYTDIKGWWAECGLNVNGDDYVVRKDVKSTAKVSLTRNGEDISGHTATQTYSVIKGILGAMDFKTFSKLVYQSMDSSLDFLSATDSNRKKFLISLLGLEQYDQVGEQIKAALKESKAKLEKVESRHYTVYGWLRGTKEVPELIEIQEVPSEDKESQDLLENKLAELGAIDIENRQVDAHNREVNKRKKQVDANKKAEQELLLLQENSPAPVEDKNDEIQSVTRELSSVQTRMDGFKQTYQRFKAEADKTSCPTCGSSLDVTKQAYARDTAKDAFLELQPQRNKLKEDLEALQKDQQEYTKYIQWKRKLELAQANADNASKLISSYTEEDFVTKCKTDAILLNKEISDLRSNIYDHKCKIDAILESNKLAISNNAKREEIAQTMEKYQKELEEIREELSAVEEEVNDISLLAEAFGPKGIVGYKIESSVKIFEELINKYLSYFSAGEFALSFELDGTKLKVVIYGSSQPRSMKSLSSGEKSAVTISTLLAIRNLMSAISKVNVNLLFLDEIISVLDTDRRELLIDLLLEEHHLNTFLVSHGFSHPLTKDIRLEKINKVTTYVS